MKIAQIAPLCESVPPQRYGGTERVVSYLTEELVRRGHDVTLFASGDSQTSAELVACSHRALRLDPTVGDMLSFHLTMLEEVRRRADDFDLLHFHVDLLQFPVLRHVIARSVTTMHGRLDLPGFDPFFAAFRDARLVSVSMDQRRPLAEANWVGNVPHGLPTGCLPFHAESEGYLAFIGRISPEKCPDRAIEIAERAGLPLKMAAKIASADREYWEDVVKPMIDASPTVEFVGEIDEAQKSDFLGNARALLFPIDWPEPFGLVTIEAMACGTPVIACRCGAMPEIIEDGVSGFVVGGADEAVAAVKEIGALSRPNVRRCFERRFTADRMARDYLAVYRSVLSGAEERVLDAPQPTGRPLVNDSTPAIA